MSQQTGPLIPYTQISPTGRIRVERVLPEPGDILVRVGDRVEASQTVARTRRRGATYILNVAQILGVAEADLAPMMVKKRGDRVEAGEVLAAKQGFLPFWYKPCRSPVPGRLVAVEFGWAVIEADSEAMSPSGAADEARVITETWSVPALIPGQVVDIRAERSVVIETLGTYVVGACGLGGEGTGVLRVAVAAPTDTLSADEIGMGFNNAVLLAGSNLSPEALSRATEMKVRGIIVGSISASVLDRAPDPPLPVVATEGYGHLPMSAHVFDVLRRLEGREVFLSARMGKPWDDDHPSIAIPLPNNMPNANVGVTTQNLSPAESPSLGVQVRAVRRPVMGRIGQVVSFAAESRMVASGLSLAGAHVAFASPIEARDAEQPRSPAQFVPWLNLERIG
jgi:hypothetical protein